MCSTRILILAILCVSTVAAVANENSPNIVLILTDDQGWSQVSQAMDPRIPESCSTYLETPNMSRLAREGMRFTSGYSPAPLCTPTRRSILCGTSAARSGTEFKSKWIPAEHMTIPRALKKANRDYRCAHFGKWGEDMISTPEQSGYDTSDGMTGNNTGGMPRTLGIKSGNHADGPPYFIDNEDPKRTRTVTDRAIDFMREQTTAKRPFYVQVSYYAVHLSVVCREQTLNKYKQKGKPDRGYTPAWAGMMEELDDGVGRLLAAIDRLGISENTYVFFTADNGGRGTVPGGSNLPTNTPLYGAKHSLYEGGIRVPFLARGPGIAPGSVCHIPVVGYDFLATFYDLAGGRGELTDEIDGVSIRPLLSNPEGASIQRPHGALFFHRPQRKFSAIRQGNHKLMLFWAADGTISSRELYHFNPDPREEERNIADRETDRANDLQAILLAYLKSVDAEKAVNVQPKRKKKER
ncbi:MAG TPA: sulfatase [Sedimentisphaerales bacterium]|nr:sulfatase [Sedimentisphaerales bacterium]